MGGGEAGSRKAIYVWILREPCGSESSYRAIERAGTSSKIVAVISICSFCSKPTFLEGQSQVPGAPSGASVQHLDDELDALFDEARSCMAVESFTSAVLTCRKILMHVAVDLGAKPGQSFLSYVSFLQKNNHIPPRSKAWVDHIRQKGNEANHEIKVASRDEATLLVSFVEMLLRITYEFPRRVPGSIQQEVETDPSASP